MSRVRFVLRLWKRSGMNLNNNSVILFNQFELVLLFLTVIRIVGNESTIEHLIVHV